MESGLSISVVANFLLLGGLVLYGFRLFAEYHAKGRWAKNATALLAGLGMLFLALAVVLTPSNAEVIRRIAQTNASKVLLGISSGFLLAAVAAFGVITYSKPLRLRYEHKIESDLNRELPNID